MLNRLNDRHFIPSYFYLFSENTDFVKQNLNLLSAVNRSMREDHNEPCVEFSLETIFGLMNPQV